MASIGYVNGLLQSIEPAIRRVLSPIFEVVLADIRFGQAVPMEKSTNHGGVFFTATTPGTANQEFSVEHAFGKAPYLLLQMLPLNVGGAAMVRLQVSQPADNRRVYLKSPDINAVVFLYLEG